MEKKTINIKFASGQDNSVIELLSERFEVIQNDREHLDLLIFLGGEDVHPSYYGEELGSRTYSNKSRDLKEEKMYNSFYSVPKLGICRGSQFLTVMNKGKLVQHVNNHGQTHTVASNMFKTFEATSTHHQMLYPFNLHKKDYELIAWSEYFKSDVYLNGKNEEIELHEDFLEPEIVYYNRSNSLAIQGHPEFSSATKEFRDITLDLIENYLFKNKFNKPVKKSLNFYDNYGNTTDKGWGATFKAPPVYVKHEPVRIDNAFTFRYNDANEAKVEIKDNQKAFIVKQKINDMFDAYMEEDLKALIDLKDEQL